MINALVVIVITTLLFTVLVVDIAKNKQSNSSGTIMGMSAVFACLGGLVIYGYSYSKIYANPFIAIIKTLLAVMGMFLGKNEYSSIASGLGDEQFVSGIIFVVIFWTFHLLALYATANAVLATIGSRALKHLRMLIRKSRKNIVLIYGVDKYAISLGSELSANKDNFIIYIDKNIDANLKTSLDESGCLYYVTKDAVNGTSQFLKNISATKNKHIIVYAISQNQVENFDYAVKLKNTFYETGIQMEKTSITLLANMEMRYGEALQGYAGTYGYGSVMVLDRAYLAAHTLCKEYPPCNYVQFDTEKAKAVDGEVFNAVIIGFGKIGQAVLKNLVINGQFEGAGFKATVFDPKHPDISGYLYKNSNSMMKNYDITLLTDNAQKCSFYEYVEKHSLEIDYIVVCTGQVDLNGEIAGEIQSTLARMGGDADIFQCTYDNIIHLQNRNGAEPRLHVTNLYTRKSLDIEYADNMAMAINHIYCGGPSALSDWNNTRFFDRMSSRASADFAPAFLRMTGITKEEVLNSDRWSRLSDVQLDNLSKTEHLRWNAFHYSMGYVRMSETTFDERVKRYLDEKEKYGKSSIKIQKDQSKYEHICLVDWDELDEVSRKYVMVTGDTGKDYKKDDTNNVVMLAEVLKSMETK